MQLTEEQISRGVVASGVVLDVQHLGCMCVSGGKSSVPCSYCGEMSGAPRLHNCRHCGHPTKQKFL